ncbi:MAG: SPOR domain-containing protein [Gammaproteobacteria bacterium]|nr:SPOR domain-containing protein [Gammaproteobacteria bacterium]
MEEKRLKQRMIGAIVLVSLAVIFIPMLLKGPETLNTPIITSNIPPKPERKTEIIPIKPIPPRPQQKPISVIPVKEDSPEARPEAAPAPEKPKSKTQKPAIEAAPDTSTPESRLASLQGWVVQVGSFSRKKNALNLQNKLRKKQFAAFVEAYSSKSGTRYRVRVGPETSSAKAKSLATTIKKRMGIDGLVLKHK